MDCTAVFLLNTLSRPFHIWPSPKASSLQISLSLGFIVVQVSAGRLRRTLTSLHTYNSGLLQSFTVSLSPPSMRTLLLVTEREETGRRLQSIETDKVLNYTEVFVGGLPESEGAGLDVRNFTGCALLGDTAGDLSPPVPRCIGGCVDRRSPCGYCSNDVSSNNLSGGLYM